MDLIKISHFLPYSARVLAASIWGCYLRWWRYSSETERLVEEAIERETWSSDRWKTWQEERLGYILHRAATKVPYYREYWLSRRRKGDMKSWRHLENWPIIHKNVIKENPQAFLADDCHIHKMYRAHTSGTTGKPLSIWMARKTVQSWYALFEARSRIWNGVSRDNRWAILGGQTIIPFSQNRAPFWIWNSGLRQLYMSSYHLAPSNISSYVNAINRFNITYLFGYASSLYSLAHIAMEKDIEVPKLQVVISNAEPLFEHQREWIVDVFRCPVRDTYGMVEVVCGASECQEGTMHTWPEAGILEIMTDEGDEPVQQGQPGRFICTGLLNSDMPLVRYEIGDRGALSDNKKKCSCGRTLPTLQKIEGRLDDVIFTPDGRRIGRLDPVFKADLCIQEAQIIQENMDRIRVLIVPASGYSNHDEKTIVKRLRQRIGDVEIVLETVDQIPRSANGKFRAVISNVSNSTPINQ